MRLLSAARHVDANVYRNHTDITEFTLGTFKVKATS